MDSTTTLIGFAMAALAGSSAMVNPISNTATLIGITSGDDRASKKAVAGTKVPVCSPLRSHSAAASHNDKKLVGVLRLTNHVRTR